MSITTRDRYARAAQRFRQFGEPMPPVLRATPDRYDVTVNGTTSTVYDTAGAARRRQAVNRFKAIGDGKLTQPPTV